MAEKHQVAKRPSSVYELLDSLVKKHHDHLSSASIIVVWRSGWKRDKDGKLILGQCKKAGDFSKALAEHDFAILLNEESWSRMDEKQRAALVDHELCHAGITITKKGAVKYRVRKHDLEEFRDIVERHGLWKEDIRKFIEAAVGDGSPSLLDELPKDASEEEPAATLPLTMPEAAQNTPKPKRKAKTKKGK